MTPNLAENVSLLTAPSDAESRILEALASYKWRDGFVCRKCGHDHFCRGGKKNHFHAGVPNVNRKSLPHLIPFFIVAKFRLQKLSGWPNWFANNRMYRLMKLAGFLTNVK